MKKSVLFILVLFTAFFISCAKENELVILEKETIAKDDNAGIESVKEGYLSKAYQSQLYDRLVKYFKVETNRDRNKVIEIFGKNDVEAYISNVGNNNVERITFTFYKIVNEVDKLPAVYNEVVYLKGIIVAYDEGVFLYWEPLYSIRRWNN